MYLGHPGGGILCSQVEGLAHLSSVAISHRNNFMIDRTLRQTRSVPLLFFNVLLLRCCSQIEIGHATVMKLLQLHLSLLPS